MKSRIIFIIILFCGFYSCKNQDDFQNKIYFTGTEETLVKKFPVDLAPLSYPVSVSSSCLADKDITVAVSHEPGLVEEYNRIHHTVYKTMPPNSFEINRDLAVIRAGKSVSEQISITVTSVADFEEAVTYLLPLTITDAEGLPILDPCKTIYVQVSTPIITSAANFDRKYFRVDQFQTNDNLKSMNAFTFETRIKVNQFQAGNPYISSVIGIEEICLLRFGDTTIEPNQLQLAGFGPLTAPTLFATGVWYHIAVTYDGTTICIYIDGNLDASTAKTGTVDLTSLNPANQNKEGFRLGFSAGGRTIAAEFSETRVWSVARTREELRNYKCYVDPSSPGLVAYWRFNEGTGKDVKDYGPNGYDITGSNTFPWVTGVKCEF